MKPAWLSGAISHALLVVNLRVVLWASFSDELVLVEARTNWAVDSGAVLDDHIARRVLCFSELMGMAENSYQGPGESYMLDNSFT